MYVVVGASGNSGHVVAEKLLADGKKVRALGRSLEHLQALTSKGAEPIVCNLTDKAAVARAFDGAEAAYVMIPPDPKSQDYRKYQDTIVDSIADALEGAEVQHAVLLSSFGAAKEKGTGPVVGLHNFEERLGEIAGLNVLCLRPGYFMENTLAQIGIIKAMGVAAGPLRAELKLPLIATRDIGAYAAKALLSLDFEGHEAREIQGPKDISMSEVATILGAAVGKQNLAYKQLPDEQVLPALLQAGMSDNVARLILEMAEALNTGHMAMLDTRTKQNTTPTSFETFVKDTFVPAFKGKATAAA